MIWNDHSNLKGTHAAFGASRYSWINYTDDKFIASVRNAEAAARGTELHDFAATCIRLKQPLPKTKKTLNMYVNDAIRFHMQPEQILFYSYDFYGTADSIIFRNGLLRVHDLKTGMIVPGHMEQLEIYAALFCLEYQTKPEEIEMELRLYQADNIIFYNPAPEEIRGIMNKIVHFDKLAKQIRAEEG